MTLSREFEEAVAYANELHGSQRRKGSEIPYLSHLLAVASLVLEYGADETEAIAALLHDAAEDCGGAPRLADIRQKFGARVAEIVEGCSDSLAVDPNAKAPWHPRKERYQNRLRDGSDPSVLLVSAADKLHNARATLADLRREGRSVWKRFTPPPADVLWNYERLSEIYNHAEDSRVRGLAAELDPVLEQMKQYA
ncbi:MAG TPA: HD domain-containing protein [Candidatus Cybelea sp.]|jgi:GTP pyrophosphokinase|nr:HD domain-containing protein [Candidatus Cybelea sp.]